MGSGIFPLHTSDENGEKLAKAASLVHEVYSDVADAVYSGDSGGGQVDNAASDGGSLAELVLAQQLILGCVRDG